MCVHCTYGRTTTELQLVIWKGKNKIFDDTKNIYGMSMEKKLYGSVEAKLMYWPA